MLTTSSTYVQGEDRYVDAFIARIESCLRQQTLTNLTDHFYHFTHTIYNCPFSFVLPHYALPLFLLELFSLSLLIAYTTYLATTL